MGLKACKFESGIINPVKAFDCLNNIMKKDDPNAYQPIIEKDFEIRKKKEEEIKQKKKEAKE